MSATAPDNSRLWIVRLMARSAVRLLENQAITILAGPLSTAPVIALRLRSMLHYVGDTTVKERRHSCAALRSRPLASSLQ
jgi:hypothetical protein